MALPDSCELTPTHLLFWELATESQLTDTEKLYEYCCTVACTNALRPLGPVEIRSRPIVTLADGEVARWGQRTLTADAARDLHQSGLCPLRAAPARPGHGCARPDGCRRGATPGNLMGSNRYSGVT